jgi:hypothetical protein
MKHFRHSIITSGTSKTYSCNMHQYQSAARPQRRPGAPPAAYAREAVARALVAQPTTYDPAKLLMEKVAKSVRACNSPNQAVVEWRPAPAPAARQAAGRPSNGAHPPFLVGGTDSMASRRRGGAPHSWLKGGLRTHGTPDPRPRWSALQETI